MHIFFTQGFFRLLVLLVFNELTALFVFTTSNKWVQKNQRAVYEWVNISDDLVYEGSVFSKAKLMSGVGFEILARKPVPKTVRFLSLWFLSLDKHV